MRSGYLTMGNGYQRYTGFDERIWSSLAAAYTNSASATAYYFIFTGSRIYPSNGPGGRYEGFPVRCLASGT